MATYRYRLVRDKVSDTSAKISNAADIVNFLTSNRIFREEEMGTESAVLLLLDKGLRITGFLHLSSGCVDSCSVDDKVVMFSCVANMAHACVLAHNHPGDDPRPGQFDIKTTERLQNSLKALGFILLDHVILADGKYFSFCEEVEKPFSWPPVEA